jgi:chorismate dehydratase
MMFENKIRIVAVSYLNTLPFLYGISNSGLMSGYEFELAYPAICAQKLIDDQVDISLLPVAAVPLIKQPLFISDYCIGAINQVKSVLLLSDVPLEQIKSVYLDYQSRTSVNLVKILAAKFWNISPEWLPAHIGFEEKISGNVAGVLIGDRTFELGKNFPYIIDLSAEWFKHTRMPFVFATWVANKEIATGFIKQFNAALRYGTEHIAEVVHVYKKDNPNSKIDLFQYLTQNISYKFDADKKASLNLFYTYLEELELIEQRPEIL